MNYAESFMIFRELQQNAVRRIPVHIDLIRFDCLRFAYGE